LRRRRREASLSIHIIRIYTRSDVVPDSREQRRGASPLLNEANGWDVAWSVLFLAADVSRWTTGTVIPVDAGMLVSAPMPVLQ
jgi:enoyl-[acyl-carrier-protein] reductase (NADH)